MAKGSITIEFDSAEDLLQQLQFLVKGVACCGGHREEKAAPSKYASKYAPPELRTDPAKPALPSAQEVEKATPPVVTEKKAEEKPAEAAPTPTATPAAEPTTPAAEPVQTQAPGQAETVTLENLATAPYEELLAFCARHPEVGVDPKTCSASFFRKLVESKIKTFLTV